MTVYLLDVNLLIAIADTVHVHHRTALGWFAEVGQHAFATCPLTENGLLRIVGNPRYGWPGATPAEVVPTLSGLRSLPGHRFWPDDISVVDARYIEAKRLLSHWHLTDVYLLALARAHGGMLATMDRKLQTDPVIDGAQHLVLI